MRRAKGSSPYRRSRPASSPSDRRFTRSAAVSGWSGSMRMSRGPSRWKLNPRSGRPSCRPETPRSNSTPSASRTPACSTKAFRSAKSPRTSWTRPANRLSLRCATCRASGSRSMPTSRPVGPQACRMRSAWPPVPTVASTYTPPGRGRSQARTASTRTGTCSDEPPGRNSCGSARRDRGPGTLRPRCVGWAWSRGVGASDGVRARRRRCVEVQPGPRSLRAYGICHGPPSTGSAHGDPPAGPTRPRPCSGGRRASVPCSRPPPC